MLSIRNGEEIQGLMCSGYSVQGKQAACIGGSSANHFQAAAEGAGSIGWLGGGDGFNMQ